MRNSLRNLICGLISTTAIAIPVAGTTLDAGAAKADEIRIVSSRTFSPVSGVTGHSAIGRFDDSGNFIEAIAQWPDGVRKGTWSTTDVEMVTLRNCPECSVRKARVSTNRADWIMGDMARGVTRPYYNWWGLYTCSQFAMNMWYNIIAKREASNGWTPTDLSSNISRWNNWQNGAWFDNGNRWE
ncbi:MAG: hypothetical protein KME30_26135 [Iphinoe sp. HA4291-MV1]|nr:hypothetical protein [Iphinoe sp. HA4291-MV1]